MEEGDTFKDIAESQVRYFGGHGKMLIPCRATVEAMLTRIPEHKLLTTDGLRKELAHRFDVQGTCPVTTRKVLSAIAADPRDNIPYWRVIKQNGELVASYPGAPDQQAALLAQEGFTIDRKKKAPTVTNYKASLLSFD